MPTAMVTFNGRITLPTQVRKQLGLNTGDSVDFVEIGKGRFAIVPGAESSIGAGADPKGWLPQFVFAPAVEDVDESIR
jgi:AbrB family looped-hinge helix DNA binding protein